MCIRDSKFCVSFRVFGLICWRSLDPGVHECRLLLLHVGSRTVHSVSRADSSARVGLREGKARTGSFEKKRIIIGRRCFFARKDKNAQRREQPVQDSFSYLSFASQEESDFRITTVQGRNISAFDSAAESKSVRKIELGTGMDRVFPF